MTRASRTAIHWSIVTATVVGVAVIGYTTAEPGDELATMLGWVVAVLFLEIAMWQGVREATAEQPADEQHDQP